MKSNLETRKNEVKIGSAVVYSDASNPGIHYTVLETDERKFTVKNNESGFIEKFLYAFLQPGWELA